MALNSTVLGTTIKATIDGLNPDSGLMSSGENATLLAAWQAIALDYETHYETLMDVLPGTFNIALAPVVGIGKVT